MRAALSPDGPILALVHGDTAGSIAWYAIDLPDHSFVILSFFEDLEARTKSGQGSPTYEVMTKEAGKYISGPPEVEVFDVVLSHVQL